jgi:predicted signal transduction protein with EAL and GGDEF domain
LHVQLAAAAAQRSARIAAVRMDTERHRERAQALELDNAELQKRADVLLRQSTEDPSTGLANRRRLEQMLRAGHLGHAALMIDIDHFKTINARFSHAVGDAVLCRLAVLLTEGCRSMDTAVRGWVARNSWCCCPRAPWQQQPPPPSACAPASSPSTGTRWPPAWR